MFDLKGSRAVVTGASGGIGRSCALALAASGAELVLFDIHAERLEDTAEQLLDVGCRATVVVGDVTSESDRARLSEVTLDGGAPDVLVNCAGIIKRQDITTMALLDLDVLWDVNVRGTVGITQSLLPAMIQAGRGKIINLGSLGSVTGLDRRTAYATTKGAVALYTKSLAREVGQYGICVNAIAPGYVDTSMTSEWILGDSMRTEQLLSRIPLGRFGRPEDVDGLLIFLASAASDYLTGQVIMLDGGWTTT
ncbi:MULTISPECIES: SDR family NAD(P)-dependent oxidoreductase [unclassified Nocardioides]|uniref:SDR family NAD(P)-dependent oxidoreductase n=1 Tax=unclassified Nocardioides TaxID=2615069 RepID=UPI0009F11542|nr:MULTISPECIES: SDR family oxidoreductase [unclassified Nocardioides]GAW47886.1 2-deoxy-D-gluconate 3-dehydrogenase [Nocardioides sp. PD653-B2]GAW53811.1 2-deoxy-D-gluconate 3-dehydrogenase [Nocardioides sp. PD653]